MIGTAHECIAWLLNQDQSKQYEVKAHKKRRSLTQNGYYWVMLNQLARKLGMPDSEVHLNMLREYGQCDVLSLSMHVPPDNYFKYWEQIGVDWMDGEERRIVKVYKGSSSMDSTEFSCLVNGMRDECEEQGICTMTPEEIARLRFMEGVD